MEQKQKMNHNGIFFKKEGLTYVRIPWVVITIIITIFIALIPTIMAYGVLNEKVNNLETQYEEAGPRHTAVINDIESRLNALEKIAATNELSLTTIQNDIGEIKQDLKEIKTDVNSNQLIIERLVAQGED